MALPDDLRPTKVVAVHLNYRSRAEQRGRSRRSLRTSSSRRRRSPTAGRSCGRGHRAAGVRGRDRGDHRRVACARRRSRTRLARDRLVRAGQRLRRRTTSAGSIAARTCSSKGQDGYTPIGPAVAAQDVEAAKLRLPHARQRRGRPEALGRRADLRLRRAGRRPLALHDAGARRRDPDRYARGRGGRDAGRRRRGGARRASARPFAAPSSRPSARSRSTAPCRGQRRPRAHSRPASTPLGRSRSRATPTRRCTACRRRR